MNSMETIYKRQSCRSFLSEQISSEALNDILKAANAAPVGMAKFENICLIVIQNKELLSEIDANAAKFAGNPDMHPLYNAPTLIVVSSIIPDELSKNLAYANAACIVENMLLAATANDLGSVYIYGAIAALNQNPELKGKLELPDGFVPVSAMAVGKAAQELLEKPISVEKLKTYFI